jgi:hypothetical protein
METGTKVFGTEDDWEQNPDLVAAREALNQAVTRAG